MAPWQQPIQRPGSTSADDDGSEQDQTAVASWRVKFIAHGQKKLAKCLPLAYASRCMTGKWPPPAGIKTIATRAWLCRVRRWAGVAHYPEQSISSRQGSISSRRARIASRPSKAIHLVLLWYLSRKTAEPIPPADPRPLFYFPTSTLPLRRAMKGRYADRPQQRYGQVITYRTAFASIRSSAMAQAGTVLSRWCQYRRRVFAENAVNGQRRIQSTFGHSKAWGKVCAHNAPPWPRDAPPS